MSRGRRTMSALPVSIRLRGIAGNFADSGSCAMHTPPTALIACAPAEPLLPIPDMITATARSRCSSASERKKSSTGRR